MAAHFCGESTNGNGNDNLRDLPLINHEVWVGNAMAPVP